MPGPTHRKIPSMPEGGVRSWLLSPRGAWPGDDDADDDAESCDMRIAPDVEPENETGRPQKHET
jgi:hypothetical protein